MDVDPSQLMLVSVGAITGLAAAFRVVIKTLDERKIRRWSIEKDRTRQRA